MRIVPIAEIFNLSNNEAVPSVIGRVSEISAASKGTNDKGDWSIQNLTLADRAGKAVVKTKLMNCEELDPREFKGKIITIYCNEGDRGLTGVKVKDDTYKGKTTRLLWVTGSAHIEIVDAELDHAPAGAAHPDPDPEGTAIMQRRQEPDARRMSERRQPASQQRQEPQESKRAESPTEPSPAPQPTKPKTKQEIEEEIHDAKRMLNRMANLYLCCLDAGDFIKLQRKQGTEIDMSEAQFQACVSSMFIEANKKGLAFKMPVGKLP